MTIADIIQSCSNIHVADAAIRSIGGQFVETFSKKAAISAMEPGVLAARYVMEFSKSASEIEWKSFDQITRGSDQPVLSGLRYFVKSVNLSRFAGISARN